MKFKFLDWYTQAIGSTFGILACIYAYLNGYMLVYGNIGPYFDFLDFSGVISSYLLLPLCLLSLILGLIKSYIIKKEILNTSFDSFNTFICILTTIIGFMGAKIYFIIPAIFILFHILEPNLHNYINSENKKYLFNINKESDITQETIEFQKVDKNISNESDIYSVDDNLYESERSKRNVMEVKKEIALDLLKKNFNKEFIIELTGFTFDEINNLEKEFIVKNI